MKASLTLLLTALTTALSLPNPSSSADSDGISAGPAQHLTRDTQSADVIGPFSLITSSSSSKYNNLTIFGLHIGAGIDLAVAGAGPALPRNESNYYSYYLNTTFGSGPGSGTLVYPVLPQLPTAFTGGLSFNTSSNVAQFWLSVLEPIYAFNFDDQGRLGIGKDYDRWLMCPDLETPSGPKAGIAWQLGRGKPDHKKCKRIEIKKGGFPR